MDIQENVPLAPLTTFKVGGPARYFAEARTVSEVTTAVDFMSSKALPLFVLGGGSNLVISDAGWPGLVLKIAMGGTEERSEDGKRLFEVGAGDEGQRLRPSEQDFRGFPRTHAFDQQLRSNEGKRANLVRDI